MKSEDDGESHCYTYCCCRCSTRAACCCCCSTAAYCSSRCHFHCHCVHPSAAVCYGSEYPHECRARASLLSHAIPCLFMFLPMVGIRRRSASKVEGEPSGWKTSTSWPGLNHVAPPLTSCRVGRLFGVPPPFRVDEHEARVVRLIWRGASSSSSSAASCSIGKGSNDTRGGAVVVVVVGGGDFVVVVGGGGSRILVGSGAGAAAAGGGGFGLRAGGGWYRWSGGGGGGLRP